MACSSPTGNLAFEADGSAKDEDMELDDNDEENEDEEPVNEHADEATAVENEDTPIVGDEDGEKIEENEEDGFTQGWDANQDNFSDFQFEREGENQESGAPVNTSEVKEASLAGLWGAGDKLITAKINRDRRFVCIDYPGVVRNVDKALTTLEGRSAISKTLSENGRMGLYFRSGDPYSKPAYANCTFAQNLLVRVRRRKKKKHKRPDTGNDDDVKNSAVVDAAGSEPTTVEKDQDPYEYQLVVEGVVDRVYAFEAMCDFQYLPVVKNTPAGKETISDGNHQPYKEIISALVPNFEDERTEYLARQTPLFLPPLTFSRRQVPARFHFEDDSLSTKKVDLIETERKSRFLGTIHLMFDHPGVPNEPHPEGSLSLDKLPKDFRESGVQAVKKMFEDRPMWSKTALMVRVEPSYRRYITFLLPMVAYYFTSGAWKNLWCRFGYDPRTHPEAKIYQTVDFRIRKLVDRSKIEVKRELETKGAFKFSTDTASNGNQESGDVKYHCNLNATYAMRAAKPADKELSYMFHIGRLPPYRQMRYQVCDILHPEIQAKLRENDGKETTCTERDGWCVPDFTDTAREILHREVMRLQALQK